MKRKKGEPMTNPGVSIIDLPKGTPIYVYGHSLPLDEGFKHDSVYNGILIGPLDGHVQVQIGGKMYCVYYEEVEPIIPDSTPE